jgi:hypothetical protein
MSNQDVPDNDSSSIWVLPKTHKGDFLTYKSPARLEPQPPPAKHDDKVDAGVPDQLPMVKSAEDLTVPVETAFLAAYKFLYELADDEAHNMAETYTSTSLAEAYHLADHLLVCWAVSTRGNKGTRIKAEARDKGSLEQVMKRILIANHLAAHAEGHGSIRLEGPLRPSKKAPTKKTKAAEQQAAPTSDRKPAVKKKKVTKAVQAVEAPEESSEVSDDEDAEGETENAAAEVKKPASKATGRKSQNNTQSDLVIIADDENPAVKTVTAATQTNRDQPGGPVEAAESIHPELYVAVRDGTVDDITPAYSSVYLARVGATTGRWNISELEQLLQGGQIHPEGVKWIATICEHLRRLPPDQVHTVATRFLQLTFGTVDIRPTYEPSRLAWLPSGVAELHRNRSGNYLEYLNLLVHFGGGQAAIQGVRVSNVFRVWTTANRTRQYSISDEDDSRTMDAVPVEEPIKYGDIAKRIWPDAVADKANQVLFYYHHIAKDKKDDMISPQMSDKQLVKLWPAAHKHMVALCAGGRNLMNQYPPLQRAFITVAQDSKGADAAFSENFYQHTVPALEHAGFPYERFTDLFAKHKMNVRIKPQPLVRPEATQRSASNSPDLETQIEQAAQNLDADGLASFERQALLDYPDQADQIRTVFEGIKSKRSVKSKPRKLDLAATLQRSQATATTSSPSPKRPADNKLESVPPKRQKPIVSTTQNGLSSDDQITQTQGVVPPRLAAPSTLVPATPQNVAQTDPEQEVQKAAQRIYDTFTKRADKFAALDKFCAANLNPKQKLAADRARQMMEDDDLRSMLI